MDISCRQIRLITTADAFLRHYRMIHTAIKSNIGIAQRRKPFFLLAMNGIKFFS